MATDLLLLRHGKAETEPADDDFERDITDKGKRYTQRVAVWLQQHELVPDRVVSSPAKRALTSAQKCCKAMGSTADIIVRDERIYSGKDDDLLDVLSQHAADAGRLMLVGHNPALERLLNYLCRKSSRIGGSKVFSPATLAHLKLPDNWDPQAAGQAQLAQIIYPAKLPKGFPFPAPHGPELRKRPAYYYTQSSVIPFRMAGNKLEILITRSSQNKHWVVPKGIAEPGHTLQESAAKEAWEEAGVEGDVLQQPIGSYTYQKWGATTTVTVYGMRVTRQLPDEEWQERHRGRQWLPAKQAASTLKQAELGPMVLALEKQPG
jgi:phosphohistidine phosphatase